MKYFFCFKKTLAFFLVLFILSSCSSNEEQSFSSDDFIIEKSETFSSVLYHSDKQYTLGEHFYWGYDVFSVIMLSPDGRFYLSKREASLSNWNVGVCFEGKYVIDDNKIIVHASDHNGHSVDFYYSILDKKSFEWEYMEDDGEMKSRVYKRS